jgi:hypothetical protein
MLSHLGAPLGQDRDHHKKLHNVHQNKKHYRRQKGHHLRHQMEDVRRRNFDHLLVRGIHRLLETMRRHHVHLRTVLHHTILMQNIIKVRLVVPRLGTIQLHLENTQSHLLQGNKLLIDHRHQQL